MIAMLDFDGVCYGLWKNKQDFLDSKREFPALHDSAIAEEIVYREVNSLEELKAIMDQALIYQVLGEGEPI